MVRVLTGRDVDGAFDAGARRLNADKRYGFQGDLLKKCCKCESHQPLRREVAWMSLNDWVRYQALLPGRTLWLIIRAPGIHMMVHNAGTGRTVVMLRIMVS